MEDLLGWLVSKETFINIGSIVVVFSGIYKQWLLSEAITDGASRLLRIYWLQIFVGVLHTVVNTMIVYQNPKIWGILSFQLLIGWTVLMSIKGLINGNSKRRECMDRDCPTVD
jgi:hypothetical protein